MLWCQQQKAIIYRGKLRNGVKIFALDIKKTAIYLPLEGMA